MNGRGCALRLGLLVTALAVAGPVASAAAPPNDAFVNRTFLMGTNINVTGWNTNASRETAEPMHAGNPGGHSVWWSWTAPQNGEVTMTTDGSDFDTLLAVYTGTAVATLTEVASSDDHGLLGTGRVRFPVAAGVTLQIAVDGFNGGEGIAAGNVSLRVSFLNEPILRPANDAFSNRIELSGTILSLIASNLHASREPEEPTHAGTQGDTSIWWTWTAPASGPFGISTLGSTFDTLLGVYEGTELGELTVVASSDDIDSMSGILTSYVLFQAQAGVTYQIAVDGFDGAAGSIALRLSPPAPTLSAPQRLSNGTFAFNLTGAPGTYAIQASEDLRAWSGLGTILNSNGVVSFNDLQMPAPLNRWYRALLQP
jgi:hypothetical protein